MKFFSLLFLLQLCHGVSQSLNPSELFQITTDVFGDAFGYLTDVTGLTQKCSFIEDPVAVLADMLPNYIRGQDQGIAAIINGFAAWQFSRQSGYPNPLVLAITGPTGVGKSETSRLIAEAILARRVRIGNTQRFNPVGYLVLPGGEFSVTSDAYTSGGLAEVHRRLTLRVIEHLRKCGSGGVIVFDEVQKVAPGTLDVLVSGLKERGEFSLFRDGKTETYSTGDLVFILTSDIGSDKMKNLLLAYDDRTKIPQSLLRMEVKKALDDQWERLNFGAVVSEVVPYLPLEKKQIEEIFKLKLINLGLEKRGIQWTSLSVDQDVVNYFSLADFVQYETSSALFPKGNQEKKIEKVFATYGARGVLTGGPIQDLQSAIYRNMRPYNPRPHTLPSLPVVPHLSLLRCPPPTGLILHVGIEGYVPLAHDSPTTKIFNPTKKDAKIILQWCKVSHFMKFTRLIDNSVRLNSKGYGTHEGWSERIVQITDTTPIGEYLVEKSHATNNHLCETIWSGKLAHEISS